MAHTALVYTGSVKDCSTQANAWLAPPETQILSASAPVLYCPLRNLDSSSRRGW
jgi:hypothetical protein